MGLELVDVKRLKITQDTAAWLEAEHRLTGKDKAVILRETLHDLASEKIRAARLLAALAAQQGNVRD